ncbi:MAG: hypothetical protein JXB23_16670, partial [Candidatus Aminicenantes bacterium]|nr:hypothetical protein [Candidatus Aminicenantes bacterium]
KKTNVRLSIGMVATVDFVLTMAKMEEEVTVIGETPIIDVTDSAMAKTIITQDFLQNIPTTQDASQLLNLAPSVVNMSAYGGGNATSNSFQLDGVELNDSWCGSGIYTSPIDYNVIEETQIVGLGAPAEYGNFTGLMINIITKSGGNNFSGDAQLLYQDKAWSGTNIDPDNPKWALIGTSRDIQQMDAGFHLGGPIIKDKLWFFGGFQYFRETTTIEAINKEGLLKYPKVFLKLTFQPSEKDRFAGYFEHHNRNMENQGFSALYVEPANLDLLYPVYIGNLSFLHQFSSSTLLELKAAGYDMAWDSIPHTRDSETPGHYDLLTGEYTQNLYWWSHWESNRMQGSATLSHYAEDFVAGTHDFKIGAAYSRASGGGEYSMNGDVVYFDFGGQPYMAMDYVFKMWGVNHTLTFFAQDSWQVTDSLTLNPGFRYNIYRGSIPALNETVYKPEGFEPRIGFAWDIFKTHKTVLKGHYGRFYEVTKAYYISSMEPSSDTIYYRVPEYGTLNYWYTVPGEDLYSIDPNIKHPSMDQFTAGVEQVVGQDLSLSLTFIHRKWNDFIESVNVGGMFEPVSYTDPDTGQTFTIYNQTNFGMAEDHYLITNPKEGVDYGQVYGDIVMVEPQRKYTAVEFSLSKRMSNNWQLYLSYVYANERGSYSNAHGFGQSYNMGLSSIYWDPNNQINIVGKSVISIPHTLKIQGTYIFPLDIVLSVYYSLYSGTNWSRLSRILPLNQTGLRVLTEPTGSRRLPSTNNLDIRLEKSFNIDKYRLRVWVDGFNLFNQGRETSVMVNAGATFGLPLLANNPRTFRAGLRFQF